MHGHLEDDQRKWKLVLAGLGLLIDLMFSLVDINVWRKKKKTSGLTFDNRVPDVVHPRL
jgi:hypothetical protein